MNRGDFSAIFAWWEWRLARRLGVREARTRVRAFGAATGPFARRPVVPTPNALRVSASDGSAPQPIPVSLVRAYCHR